MQRRLSTAINLLGRFRRRRWDQIEKCPWYQGRSVDCLANCLRLSLLSRCSERLMSAIGWWRGAQNF